MTQLCDTRDKHPILRALHAHAVMSSIYQSLLDALGDRCGTPDLPAVEARLLQPGSDENDKGYGARIVVRAIHDVTGEILEFVFDIPACCPKHASSEFLRLSENISIDGSPFEPPSLN